MFQGLESHVRRYIDLSEEDFELFSKQFTPKKIRKKQLLLEQGEICGRIAFIEKGAMYSYSIDEKGNLRLVQFAFEGWWIADLYSFFTHEPSKLCIEALEDTEVLLLPRERHEQFLKTMPWYEKYTRILYQNAYVAMQRRIEETTGLTAEEKFLRFMEHYSHWLLRVPQHLIASYLGVTPETLSRIRKNLSSP